MSFLRDFELYCSATEIPHRFATWSALGALSAAAGRRLWLPYAHFTIRPQMYIMLVGGPGSRKTTAMDVAFNLVRELGTIQTSGECESKEQICRFMERECAMKWTHPITGEEKTESHFSMFVTEFTHFIAINPAHMIDFLVTIWDRDPYITRTKNAGTDIVIGPYLTLFCCTTPDNVSRCLRLEIISGGFNRRCIFIYSTGADRPVAMPKLTDDHKAARQRMLERLRRIQDLKGEFKWTDDALAWYMPWYDNMFYQTKKISDPILAAYYESKHEQLCKIAMLIALSEGDELVIQKQYLELGLALLDDTERDLPRIFSGVGRNELNVIAANIVRMLERYDHPVPQKYVKKVMYHSAQAAELDEVINHLVQTEAIVALQEQTKDGQLVAIWLATKEACAKWLKDQSTMSFGDIRERLRNER